MVVDTNHEWSGKPMKLAASLPPREADLKVLKEMGFSLFQTDSDHLGTNETSEGNWDWKGFDSAIAMCKSYGVGWQFFPHFAFPPEWYCRKVDFVKMRCLEHDKEVRAFSIWTPEVALFLDRGFKALKKHYGAYRANIGAFYLGVHGDYGETMYPAACRMGNEGQRHDWIKRFGNDHNHYGWWCGDKCARADFKQKMIEKYASLEKLNEAWGTSFTTEGLVAYPSTPKHQRWWIDFVRWYYNSMTNFAELVAQTARRYFPDTLMMYPCGGADEDPRIGQDQSALVKMAAAEKIAIRSTHGGFRPFALNYASQFKRLASACKFYGVPFWNEPPGSISPEGEVSRFFEEISCGATAHWDWAGNPLAAQKVFSSLGKYLTVEKPVVDVALFFPQIDHYLHPEVGFPQKFLEAGSKLRDVFDYDILDEQMIADGALNTYRLLILLEGNFAEKEALNRIIGWVQSGGVVVTYNSGGLSTVENNKSQLKMCFGTEGAEEEKGGFDICPKQSDFLIHIQKSPVKVNRVFHGIPDDCQILATAGSGAAIWARKVGKGWLIFFAGTWEAKDAYYELIRDAVYNLSGLDPRKKNAVRIDDKWDEVYTTHFKGGKVLLHNPTAYEKKVDVFGAQISLPANSLRHCFITGG